jgi:magnesium transporter
MDPGLLRYFRDVDDHVRRLHEEVVAQRDQLTSALDANVALVSVRQNEIAARQNESTRQLTMVATVFLPLSFVTGFFGQNFGWLVSHIDSLGEFLAFGVGAMALSCVLLLAWFRRVRLA